MYMNLHIIVNSKNMETKNWVSDSSKQQNGNNLLVTSVAPGNFPLERPIYFPTRFSENVFDANLISATKYSGKKSHLRRNDSTQKVFKPITCPTNPSNQNPAHFHWYRVSENLPFPTGFFLSFWSKPAERLPHFEFYIQNSFPQIFFCMSKAK